MWRLRLTDAVQECARGKKTTGRFSRNCRQADGNAVGPVMGMGGNSREVNALSLNFCLPVKSISLSIPLLYPIHLGKSFTNPDIQRKDTHVMLHIGTFFLGYIMPLISKRSFIFSLAMLHCFKAH